ncbi:hypothetical protein EVA_10329 [gut metagenome]|uniref:Uncharacterized protein n=1 Tax=gut metagenome TaxID=749906 RepID=J9G407_9ZZZZ
MLILSQRSNFELFQFATKSHGSSKGSYRRGFAAQDARAKADGNSSGSG